jgi:hypothetical protein
LHKTEHIRGTSLLKRRELAQAVFFVHELIAVCGARMGLVLGCELTRLDLEDRGPGRRCGFIIDGGGSEAGAFE